MTTGYLFITSRYLIKSIQCHYFISEIFLVCMHLPVAVPLCYSSVLAFHLMSRVLPETPEEVDPKFFLHNRDQTDIALRFTDVSSLSSFNHSKRTFIIVHGFRSSGDAEWVKEMTSSLLNKVLILSVSFSHVVNLFHGTHRRRNRGG